MTGAQHEPEPEPEQQVSLLVQFVVGLAIMIGALYFGGCVNHRAACAPLTPERSGNVTAIDRQNLLDAGWQPTLRGLIPPGCSRAS